MTSDIIIIIIIRVPIAFAQIIIIILAPHFQIGYKTQTVP